MRMLSEERRQKTDQLILTSPVSVGKVVLRKYLAAAAIFTISTLADSGVPADSFPVRDGILRRTHTALLAYYLYGLSCIAIGFIYLFRDGKPGHRCGSEFQGAVLGYMMNSITGLISSTGICLPEY